MIAVGIIANPASGKDIRRLVAHGSVFDNHEKVSIVRRVLLGLEAVGVERVWIMPDSFGIGHKALDGLSLGLDASILKMPVTFTQDDSTTAATLMAQAGIGCIVTLGGDGTNRAMAKASGLVPLMPISTGTNNVFPTMIEGTIAGVAAGLVASGLVDEAVRTVPRLDVIRPGSPADIALVDVAVYDERFVAARAIWDASKIKEVVLIRAEPGSIGLSSIGAHLPDLNPKAGQGVYLRMGSGGQQVLAPIAPGLIRSVSLAESRLLEPGDEVVISHPQPCVLALDGEREIELRAEATVRVRLNANGPRVVDVRRAVEVAAAGGAFVQEAIGSPSA
jgi:hypothetical protein